MNCTQNQDEYAEVQTNQITNPTTIDRRKVVGDCSCEVIIMMVMCRKKHLK